MQPVPHVDDTAGRLEVVGDRDMPGEAPGYPAGAF
jgi:hypothetical protein